MSIKQQNLLIRRLIEEEVERLFEQDAAPAPEKPDATADSTDGADANAGDESADTDLGDAAAGDAGIGDLGGGGAAGGDGGGLGDLGDTGTDAGGDEADTTDDSAGGGGFGGFGGKKSFDFGSDGSKGLVPDDSEDSEGDKNTGSEKDTATTVGPEDVEIPADPVLATVEDAIKMLDTTQVPGNILKNVKYSIQKYFNSFDDATPVIKALWDTEDIVLRDVAKRLLIFMRGN